MRALVFDGHLKLDNDYPSPAPPSGERRVRVLRAGICNTDIEITKGYMSFKGVLGHEFVGTLEDGMRVVGEINAYDRTCPTCLRGDVTHCENRTTLGIGGRDGAFAEYLTLPEWILHPVLETVSDIEATFTEPLAAALEITERTHVKPTDRVLLIGDGKLGLLVAEVLQLTGCDLMVIGHHSRNLDTLRRRGIATATDADGLKKHEIVVDCTGNPSGWELARKLVRPRGTIVLKSTFHGPQETLLTPVVVDEVTITGSRCGPFPPALRLLANKLIDVESLLEAEYPIEKAIEAFQHAMRPGALKIQIVM